MRSIHSLWVGVVIAQDWEDGASQIFPKHVVDGIFGVLGVQPAELSLWVMAHKITREDCPGQRVVFAGSREWSYGL